MMRSNEADGLSDDRFIYRYGMEHSGKRQSLAEWEMSNHRIPTERYGMHDVILPETMEEWILCVYLLYSYSRPHTHEGIGLCLGTLVGLRQLL